MAALTAPGTALSELGGVGPKTIEKIEAHGVSSIERLADMTPEQLMAIPGIGEKMVEKIQLSVAAYFQSLESQEAAEANESPAMVEDEPADVPLEENTSDAAGEAESAPEDVDLAVSLSADEPKTVEPVDVDAPGSSGGAKEND
jgi:N utilization substance protein A